MSEMVLASAADRDAATTFAGRVARWNPTDVVRLDRVDGAIDLWARTAFGVVTHARVGGRLNVEETTVYAVEFVAALAISTADVIDPGNDVEGGWTAPLPPRDGWRTIAALPVTDIRDALTSGTAIAQAQSDEEQRLNPKPSTKATVSPRLLDTVALTVHDGVDPVAIPLRLVFGLSGMGLLDDVTVESVDVSVTRTWLRLDTPQGSVSRRRMPNLLAS